MAKFHINGKGEAGKCSAQNGKCPFGGEAEHFTSLEAARKHFEQEQSGSFTKSKDDFDFTTPIDYESKELFDNNKFAKAAEAKMKDYPTPSPERSALFSLMAANNRVETYKLLLAYYEDKDMTWDDALKTKNFQEPSKLEQAGLNKQPVAAEAAMIASLPLRTKKMIAELPLRYLENFAGEEHKAPYTTAQIAKLAQVAQEVEKNNPGWTKTRDIFPEVMDNPQWAPERAAGGYNRYKGLAVSMQRVSPKTQNLLQRYVIDKYGADKAEDFWQSVRTEQKGYNRPTLSHFFSADKKWTAS